MTEAETIGIVAGHQRLMSYNSENFRNIYELILRKTGEKMSVKTLWPIATDYDIENETKFTREYLDKRNAEALEFARKIGFYNN